MFINLLPVKPVRELARNVRLRATIEPPDRASSREAFSNGVKKAFLDLLFPIFCLGCKKEGTFLCIKCRDSLKHIPPSCIFCRKLSPPVRNVTAGRTCISCHKKSNIYGFISPFSYDSSLIRDLVHGLKYNRIWSLGSILAGLIADYFFLYNIILPKESFLVPIPIHARRKRIRGFNQTELIAENLGCILGIPVVTGILEKEKYTTPQVRLTGEERNKNVCNTFRIRRPEAIYHKTILLIDDIKTTGATLEEVARILKEAGAKQIWAITVAH